MTDKQRQAYEWVKEHDYYRSKGVRCALELVGLVDELMAADVAPVVRCKDCKWPDRAVGVEGYWLCNQRIVREDDFCSFGKRKDGEV